eukprot:2223963-Pyramimonas_sp.AAC.1
MKLRSQPGQLSDSKTRVRKECSIEGNAAAKSKNIAPASTEEQAARTDASSMSTRLDSMERPLMNPLWISETRGPTTGSINNRTAFANSRLSVLVMLSGRTPPGSKYPSP